MSSRLSRGEKEDKEPEITLSNASLLGLFLGLVLICGVFFGFGYSVGRRSAASAAINSTAADGIEVPDTAERRPVPHAASQTAAVPENAPLESASIPAQAAPVTLPFVETQPPTQPALPPESEMSTPAEARQSKKANQVQPLAAPTPAVHAMVQVAAVVHQEDADVLVSALRLRGFTAMVRNEPQDKLLHVQVGPFSSRAEANATRQRLLSGGYNAFIKQ